MHSIRAVWWNTRGLAPGENAIPAIEAAGWTDRYSAIGLSEVNVLPRHREVWQRWAAEIGWTIVLSPQMPKKGRARAVGLLTAPHVEVRSIVFDARPQHPAYPFDDYGMSVLARVSAPEPMIIGSTYAYTGNPGAALALLSATRQLAGHDLAVIGGDWNLIRADRVSAPLGGAGAHAFDQIAKRTGFVDCPPLRTDCTFGWTPTWPIARGAVDRRNPTHPRQLDHVFVEQAAHARITTAVVHVPLHPDGAIRGDHFPIEATIT